MAQDPVQVDPQHYTVACENAQVRVLRIRDGPREKSMMHRHPATVTIFLTDAEFTFTYPDGKTENIREKAGETLWFGAYEHLPEIISAHPFEAICVELKG